MDRQLTALVTGANKGIGLSIAKGLGELGYRVWIGSRDPERGQAAVDGLKQAGVDARLLGIDVADETSVRQAAKPPSRQGPGRRDRSS